MNKYKEYEQLTQHVHPNNESRFIDPFLDFSFKKIFATVQNSDLSTDFLNAIFEGEVFFRQVGLRPVEHMGRIISDRKAISDASGESIDNQCINMEMQKWKEVFTITRSIFYAANTLVSQLGKGDAYKTYPLKETYHITITDFLMDEKHPDNPIRTVKLNMQENGNVFYNNLIFKYIEMPKFNKPENALVSRLDKWLYALKNMKTFKEIPLILKGDMIFEKLFEITKVANLNQEDMTAYMKAKLDRMDYDRGLLVSEEKGHLEANILIAEKMFLKKFSIKLVQEFTELPLSQLFQIAERLGVVV